MADICDDFCISQEYDYGTCRAVTEDSICDDNEEAYGFDYCVDFERCCCGSDEVVEEVVIEEEEEVVEENITSEEVSVEVIDNTERVTLWDYLVQVFNDYFVVQETGGNETLEETGEEVVDDIEEEESENITVEEVAVENVTSETDYNDTIVEVNESVEVVSESSTNFWDFMSALVTDEYEECTDCEECVVCEECTELNNETCADYVECEECQECTEEVVVEESNIAKVLATFLLCVIIVLLIARLFKSDDEDDDFEFD